MRKSFFKKTIFALVGIFLPVSVLYAGSIDSTYHVARFLDSNFGYIDFRTTNGNVSVTDSTLTGYAWGENVGWINLSPTYGGVSNNGSGTLSGYAWGEMTGWINFSPTNGGVTIDSNGDFSGYAWSQNFGWIIFNCATNSSCSSTNFKVSTDWRVAATITSEPANHGNGSPGSIGVGGTVPTTPPTGTQPTTPPTQENKKNGKKPPTVRQPNPNEKNRPTTQPTAPPPIPVIENPPSNQNTQSNGSQGQGLFGFGAGGGGIIGSVVSSILNGVSGTFSFLGEVAFVVRDALHTPLGSAASKGLATAGVVAAVVASLPTLFANPLTFAEIGLIPLRIWGLILAGFGIKKKARPWGTVYDSVTKQPLDPAYVSLVDLDGKEITGSITDLDGRYGFLATEGMYRLVANKTHYVFPSKRLFGQSEDALYRDLYFGEEVHPDPATGLILRNIPMDPEGFDWNEFQKGKKRIMRFYSRRTVSLVKFSNFLFGVGFVTAFVALIFAPEPYNIIIAGFYVLTLFVRKIGVKPKAYGRLYEKATADPLSFAIVRIYSGSIGQIKQTVADVLGRYYCLVPPGIYKMTVEKKNADESYSIVYSSESLSVENGIINSNIGV